MPQNPLGRLVKLAVGEFGPEMAQVTKAIIAELNTNLALATAVIVGGVGGNQGAVRQMMRSRNAFSDLCGSC